MEIGKADAPIIQTNIAKHNHEPDLSRKQLSVFLRRVTERAAKEDTPVDTIYQEEVYRYTIFSSTKLFSLLILTKVLGAKMFTLYTIFVKLADLFTFSFFSFCYYNG